MSMFRRKPAAREYESWEPAATAPQAPGADIVPASAKPGRSRTSEEHLEAAVEALDAADARDAAHARRE
jgi:hypothetical protein